MTALVDANVWLPILVARHAHSRMAQTWWQNRSAGSCCWCRPVQQTVLRLLTNRTVMGEDTLSPDDAWLLWEKLILDERCAFLPMEPAGLEEAWRRNISGRAASPKLWMDAYLAVWADSAGLLFVTFDGGFRAFSAGHLNVLEPG